MIGGQRVVEERDEIGDLLGKTVEPEDAAAFLERPRRDLVAARRSTDPEVDPAGEQRFQHAEVLGDLQRTVVLEHHAARADTDATRAGRNLADEDLGARPGQPGCRVVFGEPVAVKAEAVAGLGELECFLDGVSRCPAAAYRRLRRRGRAEAG